MKSIPQLLDNQRAYFQKEETKSINFRLNNLSKLREAIIKYEPQLIDAFQKDLNKSELEVYATEIGTTLSEIRHTVKHLKKWAKPEQVKNPLTLIGAKSYLIPEPYGVALIISPWNYPFFLVIAPLIGAIAAGNCAVIKPSELAPHVSKVMADMMEVTFPREYIAVVEGDVETSTALLKEKFDYIFFTGGVQVGKIVMEAAAKHLTPVTLELGGKSPCIVHEDAKVKLAAKRIVWGKYINAGQTCVAPDYILVHKRVKQQLLDEMKHYIGEQYGDSETFTRIINERHYRRLMSYLERGNIIHGGQGDPTSLHIEPTIIDNVSWEDPVMQEEIFGPILPIIAYDNLNEAITSVNARPKPLALYIFSESTQVQNQVLSSTSFGGGCVNDTLLHFATPYLPVGGVGESGMGGYHGKASFDVFSHYKGIVKQTTSFDIPFRYPNAKNALKLMRRFLR